MAAEVCSSSIVNMSKSECFGKYGQIIGFWLDETSTGLTYSNALLEAQWITKINAARGSRMYIPIPRNVVDITRNLEDAIMYEGNTGRSFKVRDGYAKYELVFDNLTFCQMQRLKTFDGLNCYAYAITKNESIIAGDSGTNLVPFEVDVYVGEPISPENKDGFWTIKMYINIVQTNGYFAYVVNPYDQVSSPWRPSQLEGIETVEISVVSSDISANEVIFDVTSICDASEINTLLTHTDFLVEMVSTGADLTSTGITAVGNRYTLAMTPASLTGVSHRISLINQPSMTVKGYETEGYDTFTPAP